MELWKIGTSLLFLPFLLGSLHPPDISVDFYHKSTCGNTMVDMKNLIPIGYCAKDNCNAPYASKIEAFCKSCQEKKTVDVQGCLQHGGRLEFISYKK
ncbi:hypothetical protein PGT21_019669 [Puccinia graminis f. sp. tritici]|uniref:Uncharacterized protein n=1 Tax=Puccinia graminis f. sp. tritici TaxID=56615 RepID=A0A5B0SKJ2_PUCGR|nr:hypothetical protein PGT21_019669 [Puccinia graminis f. sp. tritici]KAA1138448.1 hypothetical protein PGTUg99_012124 [Puccinia graminis f. sp. tritici]